MKASDEDKLNEKIKANLKKINQREKRFSGKKKGIEAIKKLKKKKLG